MKVGHSNTSDPLLTPYSDFVFYGEAIFSRAENKTPYMAF